MRVQLRPLDAAAYVPHALHSKERAWPETNCYVDLWIELLNGFGYEPTAMLGFTFGIDFEGDQWTFFKPPLSDLKTLYGVDVQELAIWRPLVQHMEEAVSRGRLPIVEVDAFYLPDTQGISYRTEHPKTSIGVQDIDLAERRLGYFHNGGYYTLSGQDFAGVFHLEPKEGEVWLPPYVEHVKLHPEKALRGSALVNAAVTLARSHLADRPSDNPVRRYIPRFQQDLAWLTADAPTQFHAYAFATLRQLGAAFELGASFVRYLAKHQVPRVDESAAVEMDNLSSTCKAMLFKLARTVSFKKPFDPLPLLESLAQSWEQAMRILDAQLRA